MDHHSFLAKLGLGALTCNSLLAIYGSQGEAGFIAFVVAAYAGVMLLFFFLRKFDRAGDGEGRGRTKAAVWVLTTALTAMFVSRVAPVMPPFVAAVVWLMAGATTVVGFWALLLN